MTRVALIQGHSTPGDFMLKWTILLDRGPADAVSLFVMGQT